MSQFEGSRVTSVLLRVFSLLCTLGVVHADAQNVSTSAGGYVRTEQVGGPTTVICQPGTGQIGLLISQQCDVGGGGSAGIVAQATSSGVMRASASIDLRNASLQLPGNGLLINTASAFFSNRLLIQSVGAASLAQPVSVNLWWNFDGQLSGSAGAWTGSGPDPRLFGQFNVIYNPGQPDGMTWGGSFTTAGPSSPDVSFIGNSTIVPAVNFVNQSGVVGFRGRQLSSLSPGVQFLDFTMSLQAAIWFRNMSSNAYSGSETGGAAFGEADFANTATLAGVQLLDATGVDLTSGYSFQLVNGTNIPGGIPSVVVPEPSGMALMAVGMLLLTLFASRQRRLRRSTV